MRALIVILTLIAVVSAAHAIGLGEGNRFGRLGAISGGGAVIPPSPCVPGASTGEMDFSVCSNIAITAAVF